jgi:hypothetical protein
MKKYICIVIIFIVGSSTLFWVGNFVKCEMLTNMHGDEFEYGYLEVGMLDTPEYIKVLDYTEKQAKIYYVNENTGQVLQFVKHDKKWKYDSWLEYGWSKQGNEDGIIWPYIWVSAYGVAPIILCGIPILLIVIISIVYLHKYRRQKEMSRLIDRKGTGDGVL